MSSFTLSPSHKFADVIALREKGIASGVYTAQQCDAALLEWRASCNGNAPSADEVLAAVGAGKIPAPLGVALLPVAKSNGGVMRCKVGQKGGVCVYGLNRQPVTLYAEQWKRLADYIPTVIAFIKDNDGKEFTVEEYKDGKKTGRTVKSKIKYKE